jgi:hypothetical protein
MFLYSELFLAKLTKFDLKWDLSLADTKKINWMSTDVSVVCAASIIGPDDGGSTYL